MNKKLRRKLTNLLLISAMALSTFATPVMAHNFDLQGEASVMDTYQPLMHGYNALDIKNWSPSADPFSNLLRSRVPLQERNDAFAATQANPNLSSETQLINVNNTYRTSAFDAVPYSKEFSQGLYKFWQYTDIYSSWHGKATDNTPFHLYSNFQPKLFEYGTINIPDPGYVNAAHKNGVKVLGCIFLPRNGHEYTELLERDSDGTFIIAKKLAEVKDYYGFDGYFINQETSVAPEHIETYKAFTKALNDLGIYTQWYDCVDDVDGILKYEPSLIDSHASFVQDEKLGKVNDSIFINYNWNSPDGWNNGDSTDKTYINETLATTEAHGINPFDVFMGVEASMGRFDGSHNSTRNMDVILDEEGNPVTSIALFTPSFTGNRLDRDLGDKDQYRRGDDNYQWMIEERERMFYTSVTQDANETGEKKGFARPDVGVPDASEWGGVSRYVTERSVINGTTFVTNFNTGHGVDYFVNGEVSSTQEWANINLQDILPTWQWRIDTEGTKLNLDYDYGDTVSKNPTLNYTQVGAYNGGSSLALSGPLDAANYIHLYKTDLAVTKDSTLSVTFNKPVKTDSSKVSIGLIFKDAPEVTEYVQVKNANKRTNGWETATIDLSAFEGREIAAFGLAIDNGGKAIENFQFNVGEIKISDNQNHTPKAPNNFRITEHFDTNEVYVAWDMADYNEVKTYHIYGEDASGNKSFLGGIYDEAYYLSLDKDTVALHLVAVGKDGSESKATTLPINRATQANTIRLKNMADGLEVIWSNPNVAYDTVKVDVQFLGNRHETYTKTVPTGTTRVKFDFPVVDGYNYMVRISILNKGELVSQVVTPGTTLDKFCADYDGILSTLTDKKGNKFLDFTAPSYADWHKMHVQVNGVTMQPTKLVADEPVDYFIRGYHKLEEIAAPTEKATVTVTLEDYDGNKGNPVEFEYIPQ